MAFTFGGKYAQQLAGAARQDEEAQDQGVTAVIPHGLPGEISQHLQRLTKRDGTTKTKALQVGRQEEGRGAGGLA